ncbi:hypothetical protein SCHPADRAFT_836838, partial [Schizopora paradoxa]
LSEDENVVHVNTDISISDKVSEDVVHHGLEGRRTVGEAKEHHKRLKHPLVRLERCFPLVARSDLDIICPSDIELGEEPSSLELMNEVVDERERVLVLHSDGVQVAIVLNWPKRAILFLDKEERCCHRQL